MVLGGTSSGDICFINTKDKSLAKQFLHSCCDGNNSTVNIGYSTRMYNASSKIRLTRCILDDDSSYSHVTRMCVNDHSSSSLSRATRLYVKLLRQFTRKD